MKWSQKFDLPEDAAKWIIETCTDSKVWCFSGRLGAGKTTTIQSICKQLGYKGDVSSPTYAIVNEYKADNYKIYHMDLYRVKDIEEAYEIGITEYLYDDAAYILIEWPQLIQDHFDVRRYDIIINKVEIESQIREITVTCHQNK